MSEETTSTNNKRKSSTKLERKLLLYNEIINIINFNNNEAFNNLKNGIEMATKALHELLTFSNKMERYTTLLTNDDINRIQNKINSKANKVERVNYLLIPLQLYNLLSNKTKNVDQNISSKEFTVLIHDYAEKNKLFQPKTKKDENGKMVLVEGVDKRIFKLNKPLINVLNEIGKSKNNEKLKNLAEGYYLGLAPMDLSKEMKIKTLQHTSLRSFFNVDNKKKLTLETPLLLKVNTEVKPEVKPEVNPEVNNKKDKKDKKNMHDNYNNLLKT